MAKTGTKKGASGSSNASRTLTGHARTGRKSKPSRISQKGALTSMLPEGPTPVTAGVVYLGHLPHGFYEAEIRGFFSQFGQVTRVRVARSKKTARAKGYAFVEFSNIDVARIVAETMNRYYLAGKYLVAKFIPGEEAHPLLFMGAHRSFRPISWRRVERERRTVPKTPAEIDSLAKAKLGEEARRNRALRAAGIDYEFTGTRDALSVLKPAKRSRDKADSDKLPGLAEIAQAKDLPDEDEDEDEEFVVNDLDEDLEEDEDEDEDEDPEDDADDVATIKAEMAQAMASKRSSRRSSLSQTTPSPRASSSKGKSRSSGKKASPSPGSKTTRTQQKKAKAKSPSSSKRSKRK